MASAGQDSHVIPRNLKTVANNKANLVIPHNNPEADSSAAISLAIHVARLAMAHSLLGRGAFVMGKAMDWCVAETAATRRLNVEVQQASGRMIDLLGGFEAMSFPRACVEFIGDPVAFLLR